MTPRQNNASYRDLKNQVAVVIGAGQAGDPTSKFWGNGAAIAKILSESGAKIIACNMNLKAAEQTASRIQADGGFCEAVQVNATSATEIKHTISKIVNKHGRIDILVNNVGETKTGELCKAVLPIMEKQGSGSIINNASIAWMRFLGKPQVAYASAKAAVIHFTKVTGIMYANKGIRVNWVSPGMVYTPFLEKLGNSESSEEREIYKKITDHNISQGSMGDAFDVANCVAFLASDKSRYVTGQNIVVDGGLTGSTGTGGTFSSKSKL
ncbi:short chain type dehydrogenase [Penicillium malachiteum]|nr:short chain type dehydrogenase [Penicillium malachiteum]